MHTIPVAHAARPSLARPRPARRARPFLRVSAAVAVPALLAGAARRGRGGGIVIVDARETD